MVTLGIGIVIGAAIVGIIYGVVKLVSWCSETSYQTSVNKIDNKNTWKECRDLGKACEHHSEFGTEVLKTLASIHGRLLTLELEVGKGKLKETSDDS